MQTSGELMSGLAKLVVPQSVSKVSFLSYNLMVNRLTMELTCP